MILYFDAEGHLVQDYDRERNTSPWQEPICPECEQPVQWALDMGSWVNKKGVFMYAHARCVWLPEAFDKQRKLARKRVQEPWL